LRSRTAPSSASSTTGFGSTRDDFPDTSSYRTYRTHPKGLCPVLSGWEVDAAGYLSGLSGPVRFVRYRVKPMTRPTDRVLTHTFKVGARYTCTLTVPFDTSRGVRNATAEWIPEWPAVLTEAEQADYRRERDALLAELADERGRSIVVEPSRTT